MDRLNGYFYKTVTGKQLFLLYSDILGHLVGYLVLGINGCNASEHILNGIHVTNNIFSSINLNAFQHEVLQSCNRADEQGSGRNYSNALLLVTDW